MSSWKQAPVPLKIGDSVNSIQNGLAIVADGDTHAAIASGQFVYVKNHSTLSEGLYTANSAIAANAALSASNLSADSKGGLNTINDQKINKTAIANNCTTTAEGFVLDARQGKVLNDHMASIDTVTKGQCTLVSSLSGTINTFKFGNIVCLFGYATITTNITGYGTELFTVPNDCKPSASRSVNAETKYGGTTGWYGMQVDTSGKFKTAHGSGVYSEYLRVYYIYQVD